MDPPQPGAAAVPAVRRTAADINYSSDLGNLFVSLQTLAQGRNKGTVAAKRHIFSQFRDRLGPEPDEELCFSVYRLILPELDKVRRGRAQVRLCVQLTSSRGCLSGAAGVQAEGAGAGGGDCGRAEHRKGGQRELSPTAPR